MRIQTFDTLGAVATSSVIEPEGLTEAFDRGIVRVPYEITIADVATAQIEGRISSAHAWIILGASVTASAGGLLVALMPEMRLNCTAWTSGNVDAAIILL